MHHLDMGAERPIWEGLSFNRYWASPATMWFIRAEGKRQGWCLIISSEDVTHLRDGPEFIGYGAPARNWQKENGRGGVT